MSQPAVQNLCLSDLNTEITQDEPLIRDVRLGERLGMSQPLNIRNSIDRNRVELEQFGPIHTSCEMVEIGSKAKRQVNVSYLNEPQALLLCMFARTDKAAEVRKEVISVFLAARRGQLEALDHSSDVPSPETLFGDCHLIGVWQDLPTRQIEWEKATIQKQVPFTLLGYRALTREPVVLKVTAGNWVIAAHMAIVEDPDFRFVAAFV